MSPLALGLDLGSSGLRLALVESTPQGEVRLLSEASAPYPRPFADPRGWREGLLELVSRLDPAQRRQVVAIAIAGTSGTLLRCLAAGEPLAGEAGLALPYHQSCPEQAEAALRLCGDPASPAASASGSLARALRLIALDGLHAPAAGIAPTIAVRPHEGGTPEGGSKPREQGTGPRGRATAPQDSSPAAAGAAGAPSSPAAIAAGIDALSSAGSGDSTPPAMSTAMPTATATAGGQDPASAGYLLRHQADWLMGWLLGDMRWGEEGNNLRLGWDLRLQAWSGTIGRQPWAAALPQICCSGSDLGALCPQAADLLGLPRSCRVVAGSTDANAGVLAADPQEGDGITVLGTTLVLKQFVDAPISAPGISCHRVAGRWLLGGASNAGAGILRRFFTDEQIAELSRQIDPRRPSGLDLLPLPARGERFPVDDPLLEPRLGPRPISDALYLQALLEGLTQLERQGWQRFAELGAPPLRRVITLGGGARNPQWRMLRQRALGVPVLQRPGLSAALGMAMLALRGAGRMGTPARAEA